MAGGNGIARALAGEVEGDVVSPSDANWDQARQAWNLTVQQNPAVVAFPESAGDVAAAVRLARENGLRVAAQGTGHGAGRWPRSRTSCCSRRSA